MSKNGFVGARRANRWRASRAARNFTVEHSTLSQDTLEPRADTEVLIDVTLDLVRGLPAQDSGLRLLDVGTGSGCILTTLLAELPSAVGVGTDLSQGAIATARRNAEALGVDDRANWIKADYLVGIDQCFDVVIANPPYVRSS